MVFVSTSASISYDGHITSRSDGHTQGQIMAISDSYLKSCLGRERDKVEEKADRDGLWVRISKKGLLLFLPIPLPGQTGQDDDRQLSGVRVKSRAR